MLYVRTDFARSIMLAGLCMPLLAAQGPDNTVLKQVIIFGRHAVRTPVAPASLLNSFSAAPYPVFAGSGPSMITPNGKTNETLLGNYFRLWLTQEKLLTGNDYGDAALVYVRANNAPLIVDTAQAFASGLLPAAPVTVDTVPMPDPLFNPVDAGVAKLDTKMAIAAVSGRLGGKPQSLASVYSAEYALVRSILFNYPAAASPAPSAPSGKVDVTTLPITLTPGDSSAPVNLGGLVSFYAAIDPFMIEYVDGMAASDIGWGQVDATRITQMLRVYSTLLDLECRTPYLAGVQSSNVASHIVRSMVQLATGIAMSGVLGSPSHKIVALMGSDANLAGLAGLLHLDWLIDGYQPDATALGGALVFELRQSRRTGEFLVRATFVGQTMDQLRNRTALTLAAPPAKSAVFIPGCSVDNATFDCPLSAFVRLSLGVIDSRFVDLNY